MGNGKDNLIGEDHLLHLLEAIIGLALSYSAFANLSETGALPHKSVTGLSHVFVKIEALLKTHFEGQAQERVGVSMKHAANVLQEIHQKVFDGTMTVDQSRERIRQVIPALFEGTGYVLGGRECDRLAVSRSEMIRMSDSRNPRKAPRAVAQRKIGEIITGINARQVRDAKAHGFSLGSQPLNSSFENGPHDKPYNFEALNWLLQKLFKCSTAEAEKALRSLGMDRHFTPNLEYAEQERL